MKYILSIDQGTTSCRTILFDEQLNEIARSQREFTQIFPQPGWVEHNAEEIWETQLSTINEVIAQSNIPLQDIASIGIANQRETIVVWDRTTGKPVYNAIVWQDRRTAAMCEELHNRGLGDYIQQSTGLIIDAYFSATKISWILDNVPDARKLTEKNILLCGTIDSWLIWKLTSGRVHATDFSNASRTMLFNIISLQWDDHILQQLQIPVNMLPQVKNSADDFGLANIAGLQIPIRGVAGDQQAALFGQRCFAAGEAKNTYGTGCFMLMNTGDKCIISPSRLITTIAWSLDNKITYAMEGSVFIAGAAIQWLRDQMQLISSGTEAEEMAASLNDNGGVYFVPAFTGLGAPHWDMYAKGNISGLTRGTTKAHIVRAALEAIAYQTKDLLDAMNDDAEIPLTELKVDGGVTVNNWLMQFQADILQVNVKRPDYAESTVLGATMLAGIGAGIFTIDTLPVNTKEQIFTPQIPGEVAEKLYGEWNYSIQRIIA